MADNIAPSCRKCRFFIISSLCYRYPPNYSGLYPRVLYDDWCGEFQHKSAKVEERSYLGKSEKTA